MRALAAVTLLVVSGLHAGASEPVPAPDPPGSGPFGRALERAVERAQERLERRIEVWEDHSSWEDPWIVESARYRVRTTGSYAQGKRIADGLEAMFASFQEVLGTSWEPAERLEIFLFPNLAAYNTFGDEFSDERSSVFGSFYASGHPDRPVAAFPGLNELHTKMLITHAAALQFLERAFGRLPERWVAEGIGAYFALYWDGQYGRGEIKRLAESGAYRPISAVIADPIGLASGASAHDGFMELGGFFTWLLHWNEETGLDSEAETSFAAFLRAVVRGAPAQLAQQPFFRRFVDEAEEIEERFLSEYAG